MAGPIAKHALVSGARLRLHQADITAEQVDAIVNAANSHLAHGGGVAAAIVRRGGQEIQVESVEYVRQNGLVPVGGAAWTGAGGLSCRGIVHAVGPRWGEGDERAKLRSAGRAALELAGSHGCEIIAMPAISSGIFGFPKDKCAEILVGEALDFLTQSPAATLREIRFTIIDDETVGIFKDEFTRRFGGACLRS